MHSVKGGIAEAGGFLNLSLPEGQKQESVKLVTNSGVVDSGFHSGHNLSSDSFSSVSHETPLKPLHGSGSGSDNQKATAHQQQPEEVSQSFDSSVCLDSSQQIRSTESLKVDSLNDLCKGMQKMQMSRNRPAWEKYFHQNDEGDTYLHLCIIHKATEVACQLIRIAPRPWLNLQNDFGQTPLHLSVVTEQPGIVRKLVLAGAELGIRDEEGNTALHLACLNNHSDCARELLTTLNPLELQQFSTTKIPQDLEQWNHNGKRCVHIAAERSNIEILRYLVNAGANINARDGRTGLTPLHIAVESGNEPMVNFLLDECPKLRLEQETLAGFTAYQLAVMLQNEALQNGLENRGAEPLSPPESDDESNESEDEEDICTYYNDNRWCALL
ncbi:NF-kappa-B inhibitor cactus-like [Sabethes cyaneus]|uniref:NF-kappa-B inhibitor cactus-like n=1 Tax=Sabethes cyaneus TaxID=53552 RepID=UPI00237E2FB3|nr:NF-kappa-B inhibitor cactus-like [Sabethes cyaneus]